MSWSLAQWLIQSDIYKQIAFGYSWFPICCLRPNTTFQKGVWCFESFQWLTIRLFFFHKYEDLYPQQHGTNNCIYPIYAMLRSKCISYDYDNGVTRSLDGSRHSRIHLNGIYFHCSALRCVVSCFDHCFPGRRFISVLIKSYEITIICISNLNMGRECADYHLVGHHKRLVIAGDGSDEYMSVYDKCI